jgi:predicted DNA-binding protein with PD1-like motif
MVLGRGDIMRWKQIEDEPKTFVLVFETGDEIASVLQQFAREQGLGEVASKPSALFLMRS